MVPEASLPIPLALNVTDCVPPMKLPVMDPDPSTTAPHTPARSLLSEMAPCAANPVNVYPDAGESPRVIVVPTGHDMEKLEPEPEPGVHEASSALMLPPVDGLDLNVTVGMAKSAVTVPDPDTVTVFPDTDTDPLVDHPAK